MCIGILLALTSLFFTYTGKLLSHWKVTPKISTSLQLGINPIGENRSQLLLLLIVSPLHLFELQVIPYILVQSKNCDTNWLELSLSFHAGAIIVESSAYLKLEYTDDAI